MERASLPELLDFANKVRSAGGGNPIDALMPAVPADAEQCLIAKNLNFNCEVRREDTTWCMIVNTEELADKISTAIVGNCFVVHEPTFDGRTEGYVTYKRWAIELPEEIGQIAEDFDLFHEHAEHYDRMTSEDIEHEGLSDLAPYIEESYKEAHQIGVFNDNGELIL